MHRRERRVVWWDAVSTALGAAVSSRSNVPRLFRSIARGAGFAAALSLLVPVVTGCGGDSTQEPTGQGGKGTGGLGTGGADAGVTPDGAVESGAGGTAEAGTGGVPSTCGNKVVDPGEQCDDGNNDNTDGCTDACRWTCQYDDECTDHIFCDGIELCTNHKCGPAIAPLPDETICGQISTCQGGVCKVAPPNCGDTLVVPPEECDPPDGKGCDANCRFACVSTDPTRNCSPPDECSQSAGCDDSTHICPPLTQLPNFRTCGAPGSGMQCIDGACTHCGNGKVDPGEECDDGNRVAGDGCEYNCKFSCKADDPTRDCHATDVCYADGTCNPNTHRCSAIQPAPAGKSCGSGKNCIAGNCVPVVCGDGVTALGVETCDDGNLANADGCTSKCTPSCVNASTDCKGVPSCEVAACSNSVCSFSPNASLDGRACSSGGGSGTCHSGACTAGVCGDGNVDAGEQCDLGAGNNVHGSGCEPTCLYSCQTNADCDDGDPCNGVEKCTPITGGQHCTAGTPMNTGDVCQTSPRRICLKRNGQEGCVLSTCGDGFTDTATEQCDPPNTVGCDSTCKGKAPCNVTGRWGMKVVVNVSWGGGNGALAAHTGTIVQWTLIDLTQAASSTSFTANDVKVCGIVIPDFQGISAAGGEWYGLQFADSTIWDKSTMPTFTGTGRVSNLFAGATIDFDATAILVGLTLKDPSGAWPSLSTLLDGSAGQFVDQDGDGEAGVTLTTKSGAYPPTDTPPPVNGAKTYSNPIVNAGDGSGPAAYGRADRIYVGIRALSAESGTLDTCNSITGQATVSSIDNHIPGCYTAPCTDSGCTSPAAGGECLTSDAKVADAIKPVYTVSDATFTATRLSSTANCGTVRTTLP